MSKVVQRRDSLRPSAAFSLVELLVVIGIITLLVGLTVSVSVRMVERSEVQQTERIIDLLDAMMLEWETATDRKPTWGEDDVPPGARYDLQTETEPIFVISELLDEVLRVPSAKEIFSQIDPRFVYEYQAGVYPEWVTTAAERQELDNRFDGSLTVLDAWGWPIYSTHPGRKWEVGDPAVLKDDDGTLQTYLEQVFGVTRNRQVCFVSAGPDRQYGVMHYPPQHNYAKAAQDNLYSYPVLQPPIYTGSPPWQ